MVEKTGTIKRQTKKLCSSCIMPETAGHIIIDEDGICNICKQKYFSKRKYNETEFDELTKNEKFSILQRKINRYRSKESRYDCICSVSGGKDSIMTLYIAKRILGLNPLAVMIDNGFLLDEMLENIMNATEILRIDSIIYRMFDMQDIFKILLMSKKRIYFCRVCHALIDLKIREIAKKYEVSLILGGYTKGQQYIKSSELFWIYDLSDNNTMEVLSKYPQYNYMLELCKNQTAYFNKYFPNIVQISPFKYIKWDEEEIIGILEKELRFKKSDRSWPENSSNCLFNYVSQLLAEKNFGYAQHEVELSELVRSGELSRDRALHIYNSPILKEAVEEVLAKLELKIEDIGGK